MELIDIKSEGEGNQDQPIKSEPEERHQMNFDQGKNEPVNQVVEQPAHVKREREFEHDGMETPSESLIWINGAVKIQPDSEDVNSPMNVKMESSESPAVSVKPEILDNLPIKKEEATDGSGGNSISTCTRQSLRSISRVVEPVPDIQEHDIKPERRLQSKLGLETLVENPKFRARAVKIELEAPSGAPAIKDENFVDNEGVGEFESAVTSFKVERIASASIEHLKTVEGAIDGVKSEKLDEPNSTSWEPEVIYLKCEKSAVEDESDAKDFKKSDEKPNVDDDSAQNSKEGDWRIENITNGADLVKKIKKMVSMNLKANVLDSPSTQRYLKRRTCSNTKIEPDEFFDKILKDVALSEDQSKSIRELRRKIDFSNPETITFSDGFKFHLCLVCGYQTHVPACMTNHVRIHTGDKPYVCEECDYRCCTSQSLRVHKRTHTGEKPYGCTYCSYRTRSANQIKIHTMAHEGKKPIKCPTCDFRCRDPKTLKQHIRRHTGEKPYACPECDYRCSKSGGLKSHMRVHSGEKPYKCSYCPFSCAGGSSMAIHIRIHTGEKPFSCQFCSYKANSAGRITTHTRTHTGDKPFECSFCGHRSSTHGRHNSHVKTHTGVKNHHCPHCDYKSARSDNLKVHLMTHTGEKPYACHLCEYRASEKAQLTCHIRRHTGEKPFACKVCGFKTADPSSLRSHEKVHSEEKPLSCLFCEFRTQRTGIMKNHVMRHTGLKPYSCPYCPYRGIKSCAVKNHVRQKHPSESKYASPERYACASCPFLTFSRKLMESHAASHLE